MPTQTKDPVSTISPQADLPPMPPAFQSVAPPPAANTPPVISSSPKKKFGGGRIIATLLGLLLLVGGVGAGYLLTQQPQLFQQLAGGGGGGAGCGAGYYPCNSGCCPVATPKPSQKPNCNGGASRACTTGGCSGVQICNGVDWGPCVKSDPACGTGGGGGSPAGSENGPCLNGGSGGASGDGCNTGLHCVNGKCQRTSTPNPCGAGLIQCNGVCTAKTSCPNVPAGGFCTSTSDCQSGYVCQPSGTPGQPGTCVVSPTVDCGGAAKGSPCTSGSDCHCTGGDACTGKVCDPDTHSACLNQGRSWCVNQSGNGYTCCVAQYVCVPPPGKGCMPQTGGNTTTPTTASCQGLTTYSSTWNLLSTSQLSGLKAGDKINFCALGTASAGTFDMARFTINGTVMASTSTKGQGAAASAYCQNYSIPQNTTTFNISAEVHHVTLGWVK